MSQNDTENSQHAQLKEKPSLLVTCELVPAEYRAPAVRPSLEEAKAYCKHLAETHYENFHVATWFLPKRLRPHFQSIYAYCRIADDLGDEVADPQISLQLLDEWGRMLDECYDAPQSSIHPVFVALAETVRACRIPREPFADLLVAFRRDQTVTRYDTLAGLIDYSRYSANPVGRLVLYASGHVDPQLHALSDRICTGLQLANFWQDVAEDYQNGRLYLPGEIMRRYEVTEEQIAAGECTPRFRQMMKELVTYTYQMFAEGSAISQMVDAELAVTLDLFCQGGVATLQAIEQQNYDVLKLRPVVSKSRKATLLLRALAGKLAATFAGKRKTA
ncbi:MAG: squalene synthase HpnC [Acidobacteriaceae bacterium]